MSIPTTKELIDNLILAKRVLYSIKEQYGNLIVPISGENGKEHVKIWDTAQRLNDTINRWERKNRC